MKRLAALKKYGMLFANRPVMLLISAGFISSLGNHVSYFALLKKVYDISGGRITDLGFLTVMKFVPFLLCGLFAGRIVDCLSRRMVMVLCDVFSALAIACVIFVDSLPGIYFFAFLSSLVYVFRQPAQSALEPNLVRREDLVLYNSFNSSLSNVNLICGSAFGAAVAGLLGTAPAFLIDGATFLISALIIYNLRVDEKHISVKSKNNRQPIGRSLSAVWSDLNLRRMLLINTFVTIAMTMQGILIYFHLKDGLGLGDKAELAWGVLLSALGIGIVVGSLLLGLILDGRNPLRLYLNILFWDGLFFLWFLLNGYNRLAILIFAFLGLASAAHTIILNTIVQQQVADENRGQVFALFSFLESPAAILSLLIGTFAAAFTSAWAILILSAIVQIILAVALRFCWYRADAKTCENVELSCAA
ncbi:MAG: MFS transporter [Candidatus Wallbacteria bacterium]|nr:MFS transporter [Candidatus Wallbacteria bacterium]